MTLSAVYRVDVTWDGVSAIPYTFKIWSSSDLRVVRRTTAGVESVLVLTTNYTVSGVGSDSGGNVTITSGASATDVISIYSNRSLAQDLDLKNETSFLQQNIEDGIDKAVRFAQQANGLATRGIRVPESEAAGMVLPTAVNRANKVLGFDGSGNLTLYTP